jgi:hypothetical protein
VRSAHSSQSLSPSCTPPMTINCTRSIEPDTEHLPTAPAPGPVDFSLVGCEGDGVVYGAAC